jgi:hypothetical protein
MVAPAGTTSVWLALVLTVNGLVVLAPLFPNVVVQVAPPFGIDATQVPAEIRPTLRVTVSLNVPLPPFQYMVNDQVPVIVCAVRPANVKTDVLPFEVTEHGVARAPIVVSMVEGVQAGEAPVPWTYRGLPADSTTETPVDPHASAPTASPIAPTTTHPIRRWT